MLRGIIDTLSMTSRIFNDKRKLRDMLSLYSEGLSQTDLAEKFNCDHSSIAYQVQKYGVVRFQPLPKRLRLRPFNTHRKIRSEPPRIVVVVANETPYDGKSYAEYLQEERLRRERRFGLR